ncbi:protein of unknown function [Pedococcus cremeus]|uniref:DUF4386 domain-containing protein n=1 Tax=Pedococcus cremeus TaxID=587636 RepID=A0A1H9TJ08_9MICO|nr:protein of unknown function [Pedococcus cremeus]
MTSTRRTSVTTGVLLVVATFAAIAAATLLPTLSGSDRLAEAAGHSGQVATAALLYLVAAGTSVGIAITLYPLLKEFDVALALGSVVFRTIEAVFYTVGVVSLLSLLTLGEQHATASSAGDASTQASADVLLSVRGHSSLVAVFAFSVGALMYYVVFFRSRLVPRWLSVFGIVAVLLMLCGCLLALFSDSDVTGYKPLVAPIFLQELVLAVWLLVKGFSRAPLPSEVSFESPLRVSPPSPGRR